VQEEDELDHIGEMGDEEDQPPVEPGDDEEDEGNNEDLGEVGGMGYENVTAIDKEKEYGKEFDMILAKVRTKRKRSSKPSAEPGGEKEKTPDAPDLQTFILHMESACERDRESMKKKTASIEQITDVTASHQHVTKRLCSRRLIRQWFASSLLPVAKNRCLTARFLIKR